MYQQEFDDYVYRGSSVFYVNYRRLAPTVVVPAFAAPYYSVNVLPEREVGLSLRVGFGSR